MMYMRCDEPRQWGDLEDSPLSPGSPVRRPEEEEERDGAARRGVALGAAGVLLVAALTVAGAALVVASSGGAGAGAGAAGAAGLEASSLASPQPPRVAAAAELISLAEARKEGKGQEGKKDGAAAPAAPPAAEGKKEEESHIETIYLANVTRALVLHDVKGQGGGGKSLSAKEGDLVVVGQENSSAPWTFAYTAKASGYLPTEALNKNLTRAVGNYTPPGKDGKGRLEVSVGEKVWLRADGDRGAEWASVDKVASNGTVVRGWVPRWAVDRRGYTEEKKEEAKEEKA